MWAIKYKKILISVFVSAVFILNYAASASAITALPTPPPQTNSYGLEATKKQPAPTEGVTISIPANGAAFTTSPITVSGICPSGLLVEIYDNGVLSGSINCTNGSFSVQVGLFNGSNVITANDYDAYDQSGPPSNSVTVSYNNPSLVAFGELITLTSNYGRIASNVGTALNWPLLLSGGTGPYAFSIAWGDSQNNDLKSVPLAGEVTISHTYKNSGIYHVTIQVTDVNGAKGYLQVVAVANGGSPSTLSNGGGSTTATQIKSTSTTVLWLPTVFSIALMVPIYILGRRSQLIALRKKLDKDFKQASEDKK